MNLIQAIAVVAALLPTRHPLGMSKAQEEKSVLQKWLSLDWIGAVLSLAMATTLILPIQWGGVIKPWNDPAVISLFVVVRNSF